MLGNFVVQPKVNSEGVNSNYALGIEVTEQDVTSNYTIKFRNNNNNEDTNINVHNNVIGFRLLKANVRSPPFNVNSTNNKIVYINGANAEP